jgi:type 1 fimbriae regulatory protein FimE
MLRYACSYALADNGTDFRVLQDYMGHRNPRHTAHYTRTNPARFAQVWDKKQLLRIAVAGIVLYSSLSYRSRT